MYREWRDDFAAYLSAVRERLEGIAAMGATGRHTVRYGDARSYRFPRRRFRAMVTSPPYPNRHDFGAMFRPEQKFMDWLEDEGLWTRRDAGTRLIGTGRVADRKNSAPSSESAQRFLRSVDEAKRDPAAKAADDRYYIPYLANYFADIEAAYGNVSLAAHEDFEGYIVVRNNTHRGLIVPVSGVVMDTWVSQGFRVEIAEASEWHHVGTMNPRARGFRARHMEYVIRAWRP